MWGRPEVAGNCTKEMGTDLLDKLKILAESAKYDVSCSSGGVRRRGEQIGRAHV